MEEIELKIVELVRQGYTLKEISKTLNLNYVNQIFPKKKRLMEEGYLTQEDFERGKEERKRREYIDSPLIQKVFKYKLEGFSDTKISRMSDIGLRQTTVSRYIREGIKLGIIKREDIEKAEREKKEEDKLNNLDRKRILVGLKRGETYVEIAKDTTVGGQQVKNISLSLIEEGVITQEEIDVARQRTKQEKQIREREQQRKK